MRAFHCVDRLDVVAGGRWCSTPAGSRAPRSERPARGRTAATSPETALHQRQHERVGVARGVDVDLLERDHVAPEDHRLQVEAPAAGQHAGDALRRCRGRSPPGVRRGTRRASRSARRRRGSRRRRTRRSCRGRSWRASYRCTSRSWRRQAAYCARGQRDAEAARAARADEVQQRAPAAAEVEHAAARRDADLLGDVLVLVGLRLLRG